MKKKLLLLLLTLPISFAVLSCQTSTYVDRLTSEIHETSSDSTKGHNYIRIAQYFLRRDIEKSEVYIDSARSISNFSLSGIGDGLILMAQGELKVRQKENAEALELLRQAKGQFQEIQNNELLNYVEYEIGAVHLAAGDYLKANTNFIECRKYATITGDTLDQARAITALGVVQRRLGNLDEAYEYYAEALPIYIQKNHANGHSTSLLNLAIIEKQRKNYDSSQDLYEQALQLAQNDKPINPNLLSYVYGNMSSLFDETKDYKNALLYGEKALELRKESASNEELASSYSGLARNTYHLKDYKKALSYIELAKLVVEGNENILFQLTKTESDILFKLGRYNRAYKLLSESNVYRDSIYSSEKNKQIAEINTKYETEIKEAEIKELELEDQLNNSRIRQQRNTIIGLGLGLGVLSLLLYNIFNQKNEIKSQNATISKSAAEKDILLREIHHRVKNNLQVISSLLGIQGRSIKDEKAKEAIQEGRNRVQSMALIHQNLYKKDNLTGIEMKPYIDKLGNHLLQTYHVEEGSIELVSEVADLTLDVETVVPIGLIINELISNSLKYAFPEDGSGIIKISLSESEDHLLLSLSDDGIGLNEAQLRSSTDTFGHSLIRAFKSKLDAQISISSDLGTQVTLKIKNYKKVS